MCPWATGVFQIWPGSRFGADSQALQQATREGLLQCGHHERGISLLRFTEKKMNVLRHDDVAHNYEAVAVPNLLHDLKEEIASVRPGEKRTALVATGGDVVQISGPVIAVQVGGHSAGVAWPRGIGCDE